MAATGVPTPARPERNRTAGKPAGAPSDIVVAEVATKVASVINSVGNIEHFRLWEAPCALAFFDPMLVGDELSIVCRS